MLIFVIYFFETIKSYSISSKELKKRVIFSDIDELNHKLEKKEKSTGPNLTSV